MASHIVSGSAYPLDCLESPHARIAFKRKYCYIWEPVLSDGDSLCFE